jgi:hypothetical protein
VLQQQRWWKKHWKASFIGGAALEMAAKGRGAVAKRSEAVGERAGKEETPTCEMAATHGEDGTSCLSPPRKSLLPLRKSCGATILGR